MSLVLSGVHAGYGSTEVLRGVDLAVPSGHVVALLGPNGAGKTTALRTCSGLLRPSRGTVLLDGDDITRMSAAERSRRGLCHITEGRVIFRGLTVEENLRLMADGPSADAAEAAMQAFPALGRRMGQVAGTMSGGEQQMLALARSYVAKHRYVLLDEVSLGLAPVIVDQIFDFLRQLVATGTALLIVEQYVARALELADLVYLLNKGSIQFAGEPGELDADDLASAYLGAAAPSTTGRNR